MTRWEVLLWTITVALIVAIVFVMGTMQVGAINGGYELTVDGVDYAPTKIVGNGPTVHYFTPATDTVGSAFTERHTWTGNGSGNLPCDGLVHWIDNANVLTISHCEESPGTTTTTIPRTTTTTLPEVTTTTQVVTTTTTTVPSTTTTRPPTTSTTVVGSTTTTTQVGDTTTTTILLCGKGGDAPCGGVSTGGGYCALHTCTADEVSTHASDNGSGAGWVMAGLILLVLALGTLVGSVARGWWIGKREANEDTWPA